MILSYGRERMENWLKSNKEGPPTSIVPKGTTTQQDNFSAVTLGTGIEHTIQEEDSSVSEDCDVAV